jgi:hypothetical protein
MQKSNQIRQGDASERDHAGGKVVEMQRGVKKWRERRNQRKSMNNDDPPNFIRSGEKT